MIRSATPGARRSDTGTERRWPGGCSYAQGSAEDGGLLYPGLYPAVAYSRCLERQRIGGGRRAAWRRVIAWMFVLAFVALVFFAGLPGYVQGLKQEAERRASESS